MRTKYEILRERAEQAHEEAMAALKKVKEAEALLTGLADTPCNLTCSGCGTHLETEADFARHFIIPDERYPNLGECPVVTPPEEARAKAFR